MSEFKTAREYIETEYGTQHLARIFELNDVESMLDVMDDFNKFNLEKAHAPQMLDMLKDIKDCIESGNSYDVYRIDELIQQATTIK